MAGWKCVNIDHVPFCEKCHSILDPPDQNNLLKCNYCDFSVASTLRQRKSVRHFDTEMKRLMNKQIEKELQSVSEDLNQKSKASNDKWLDELESDKALRDRLKKQVIGSGGKKMIKEECLQCGAKEMAYEARQLRSVDEGQTIFYECLECGNKTVLHS